MVPVNNNHELGIFDGILVHAARKLQDCSTALKIYAVVVSILGGVTGALAIITFIPTFPIGFLPLVGLGCSMLSFHVIADMIRAVKILIN